MRNRSPLHLPLTLLVSRRSKATTVKEAVAAKKSSSAVMIHPTDRKKEGTKEHRKGSKQNLKKKYSGDQDVRTRGEEEDERARKKKSSNVPFRHNLLIALSSGD